MQGKYWCIINIFRTLHSNRCTKTTIKKVHLLGHLLYVILWYLLGVWSNKKPYKHLIYRVIAKIWYFISGLDDTLYLYNCFHLLSFHFNKLRIATAFHKWNKVKESDDKKNNSYIFALKINRWWDKEKETKWITK